MLARLYTHGWDCFSPGVTLAYHLWQRSGRPVFEELVRVPVSESESASATTSRPCSCLSPCPCASRSSSSSSSSPTGYSQPCVTPPPTCALSPHQHRTLSQQRVRHMLHACTGAECTLCACSPAAALPWSPGACSSTLSLSLSLSPPLSSASSDAFGLGTTRTLAQLQAHTGVDLAARTASSLALTGGQPESVYRDYVLTLLVSTPDT